MGINIVTLKKYLDNKVKIVFNMIHEKITNVK